tara:strand:- start:138 stop:1796 length:1659 start_codon:yes stop_codon:yes gene_type:complete
MRSNFKYRPNTGFPDIDDSIFTSSATQRIDNVNFKYFVYLVNADGVFCGLTPDAINLLQISDNVLEYSQYGTLIFRNDNDAIERTNLTTQLTKKENYFARQPKNVDNIISEFFFRNDCRDYVVVYIEPDYTQLADNETDVDLIPYVTLQHVFSVIDNEDIVDESNTKYKSLKLVDRSLELFREKNIDFSTANLIKTNDEIFDLDDDERGVLTGDVLKAIIRMGVEEGGMGETIFQDEELFSSNWDPGTSKLFYSSPSEFNTLDDIKYVLNRHTSAEVPFDRCLLRKHRYFNTWSLISLKNYFQNAIKQNEYGAAGGLFHIETVYLGTEADNNLNKKDYLKNRAPTIPIHNETIGEYSMVDNFKFFNMAGLDNQSEIVTTAVHSYQLNEKQFQIDLTNNNITKCAETYFDYYVKGSSENTFPLFLANNKTQINSNIFINSLRSNNINYKNDFSINDKEPDQRLGKGRNMVLTNAIFKNNAIELDLQGLSFRQAGKFFSFNRTKNIPEGKFDDKVFGTYFLAEVQHIFSGNSYSNKVIGVKTYLYSNPNAVVAT